ncbi:unnamed protein product [Cuscuta campestris]|uniref:Transposase (putative) gypsy type domain-containing protein n=1 Tax=Cuscuta campestris TaxID=132261 RepID=A0A484N603_9ASTE|nr:unnamed protein product [Cuscuta campestris]
MGRRLKKTSNSQSSSSSERPATSQQEKPVDASTCALSTSAEQVVSVARPMDEGFVLVDDQLFLEQPSFMQRAQVHKLRNLLPEGYQLSYRATWKNIISLHASTTIGIHYHSIKNSGEFSIHPFKVLFFETYGIMPGQLTTNGHRMLSSFINFCQFLCIPLSLRLFDHMFDVWPGSKETLEFVIVSSHQGRAFLSGLPPSNRGWKEKYVSIKFPPGDFPFAQNAWGEKTQGPVVKFNSKFSIPHIEDVEGPSTIQPLSQQPSGQQPPQDEQLAQSQQGTNIPIHSREIYFDIETLEFDNMLGETRHAL